jgi:hypothetical protein
MAEEDAFLASRRAFSAFKKSMFLNTAKALLHSSLCPSQKEEDSVSPNIFTFFFLYLCCVSPFSIVL